MPRITIDVDDLVADTINDLAKARCIATRTELMRDAQKLYTYFANKAYRDGYEILIAKGDELKLVPFLYEERISGRNEGDKSKIRITIDLSTTQHEKLEEVRRLVGAESKAGVFRMAVQFYKFVYSKVRDEGYEIRLKKGDEIVRVEVFAMI